MKKQVWICPVCQMPLQSDESGVTCANGHHFDRSAQGYIHLLPANRMHAKLPGDNAAMIAARHAFLSRSFYRCLREAICDTAIQACRSQRSVTLLDCGCGEGYYTEGVTNALRQAGKEVSCLGIDLSKSGLRYAAKRLPDGEFAVASCYHLPLAEGSTDLALNLFSPLCIPELSRVLLPNGIFLYAVPDARHLWQMKEILYETPYLNAVRETEYEGFRLTGTVLAYDTITIEGQADIQALFSMTPYYWKTPKAGAEALARQNTLTTEIAFRIYVYEKL